MSSNPTAPVPGPVSQPELIDSAKWANSDHCFDCGITWGYALLFGARRHHCRLCGKSFCYAHAPYQEIPPHGSIRSCSKCFNNTKTNTKPEKKTPSDLQTTTTSASASASSTPTTQIGSLSESLSEAPKVGLSTGATVPAANEKSVSDVSVAATLVMKDVSSDDNSKKISKNNGDVKTIKKYVEEIRFVSHLNETSLMMGDWVKVEQNLNPTGKPLYLIYRLTSERSKSIVHLRIIKDNRMMIPGYQNIETNLNEGSPRSTTVFLSFSKQQLHNIDPISAIIAIARNESVPFALPASFQPVSGDYSGNLNTGSSPNIYLAITRSQNS
jgi:hypothetical protein